MGHRSRAWRSLSARLALWYVVVTVVSFLLAATVFAARVRESLELAGNRSASGVLERYRQAFEAGGTTALRSLFDCSPASPQRALRLTDEKDVELFELASDDGSRRAAASPEERGKPLPPSPEWRVARTAVSQQRTLSIAFRDEGSDELWRRLRGTSIAIFGFGLAFAILGAMFITRRTLRPVTALVSATRRVVESGDLALRVDTRASTDELSQLSRLFNHMQSKNEELVKAMRESLDYVAHDLRTPLTRLRAGAELALRGAGSAEESREALADIVEETDRVLGMLTTLTDIVEAEAGAMRLDRHDEDLGQIVREAVELYDFVASEGGVAIVTHIDSGVSVHVDRRRISQVAANLVDNAVKYTPTGGRVEVSVVADGGWGVLRISDTGIGIAPEDQPRVWDRLFRADRSRGERGLGLGLSLVRAVVAVHGGLVRLESELGSGTTFEVHLARTPARE
ncbi:MAG TPA: ATP-binding protein [Polyangiaceae bacterium]|jgi:signal transduction histidine kinase|nr:ATP-binding protein [Polyangiaceae bacterium]